MVEVKVVDHGPGIPTGDRDRVFEEFYRQDVEGRRGGTGLGLPIARAVVMAHGGTMWVEDSPGGGATIGVPLPPGPARGGGGLRRGRRAPAPAGPADQPPGSGTRRGDRAQRRNGARPPRRGRRGSGRSRP